MIKYIAQIKYKYGSDGWGDYMYWDISDKPGLMVSKLLTLGNQIDAELICVFKITLKS
jgi:hypothetical protein